MGMNTKGVVRVGAAVAAALVLSGPVRAAGEPAVAEQLRKVMERLQQLE